MTLHTLIETTDSRSSTSSVETNEVELEGTIDQRKEFEMINITAEDHEVLKRVMDRWNYQTGEEFALKELTKATERDARNEAGDAKSVSEIVIEVFGSNWEDLASYLEDHLETCFHATVIITRSVIVQADDVDEAEDLAHDWYNLECDP